ncbi:MAG: DNA cytosine methyltransferase, partial [Solirubrobacteraceae bacterium]
MALTATRTIGGGDGWDRTDSGIYVPDWAELEDVHAGAIVENPERQPLGIDLFAGAGGFSCGFKQAGWHVIAANECDVDAAHTYLCNLGSPRTRIVF